MVKLTPDQFGLVWQSLEATHNGPIIKEYVDDFVQRLYKHNLLEEYLDAARKKRQAHKRLSDILGQIVDNT